MFFYRSRADERSCGLGIVALTIGVPHHRRAPCLARDPAAPSQECEATGKKHATFWRLTSPVTPAILRGVGLSPGHTIPQMASVWRSRRVHADWGVWGMAKDSRRTLELHPFNLILISRAHFGRTREAVSSRPAKQSLEQPISRKRTCALR